MVRHILESIAIEHVSVIHIGLIYRDYYSESFRVICVPDCPRSPHQQSIKVSDRRKDCNACDTQRTKPASGRDKNASISNEKNNEGGAFVSQLQSASDDNHKFQQTSLSPQEIKVAIKSNSGSCATPLILVFKRT